MRSVKQLMNLEGRVALITGGGGHIGSVIGDALSELGAEVVLVDVPGVATEKVAKDIERAYGGTVLHFPVDLGEEASVRALASKVLAATDQRMDVLVNCAAMVSSNDLRGWTSPFLDQRVEPWRMAMEVNLTAPFILTQLLVPALKASGHGSIINVGSTYGVVGPDLRLYEGTTMGNSAAYAVSKGGLIQFTRWLSTVLAPEIRVNAISPGGVFRNHPQEFHSRYVARTPLGRMAKEEDFKGAALFLASDLSAYVTGQNIMVDGGFTAW